jgi:Fic family protein
MPTSELEVSPIGQLVEFTPADGSPPAHAYLAHDLPDEVELTQQTWKALIAAHRSLARVNEAARRFENADILSRPSVWKEALGSSAIEGTVAAFTDVVAARLEPAFRTAESREVTNYFNTYLHAYEHIAEHGVSSNFLCQLQQELLHKTADDSPASGRLRDDYVVIGKRGADLNEARFIPSPPGDVLRARFERLIERVERPSELDPLVEIALVHYQFETLHPFHNGNGRLGRMLIGLQLRRFELLGKPLLSVSTWISARRTEYLDHLFEVSRTGDFEPWIRFFVKAVEDQSAATVVQIDLLIDYRSRLRQRIKDRGYRGIIVDVADGLLDNLVLTAPEVSKHFDISDKHARTVISQLEELGALVGLNTSNPKLYAAKEIIDIIENS